MSERKPTAEQRAAIEATAAEVMVEAGAGTGKTGVMVDRYCRLVCEQGVSPGRGPRLHLHRQGRRRAAPADPRRDRAPGRGGVRARPASCCRRLGSAWVTTIHGFCNRLLSAHPVAVGIDPRFRVLDAPETERAAVEAFDEALEAFLAGGDREPRGHGRGVRHRRAAGDRDRRPRRAAQPRRRPSPGFPSRPSRTCRERCEHAAAAAAETLAELKPGSANHELVERALALLEGTEDSPGLDEMASLRTGEQGETDGRLQGGDRGGAEPRRRGRRGRPRLPPRRRAAAALLRALRASPRRGAPASTSRTCSCWPRACSSGPRRGRPTGPASATSWSTSSRTPTACSCA